MSLLCHSLHHSERDFCECGVAAFVHIELDSLSIHLPAIHAAFFIPSSLPPQYERAPAKQLHSTHFGQETLHV